MLRVSSLPKRGWLVVYLLLIPFLSGYTQLVTNASFEGTTGSSRVPPGWTICGGSPDVQIISGTGNGIFAINTTPTDGSSYMGLVTTSGETYREAMGQQLPAALQAGQTYTGSVDLFYSNKHTSWNGTGKLQIWAGNSSCAMTELLFDSGVITTRDVFGNHQFSFTPTANRTHIVLVNRNLSGGMDYLCADNLIINITLPADYLHLHGQHTPTGNEIKWDLEGNHQPQSFRIERSGNGLDFETLEIISNFTPGNQNFEYKDRFPLAGSNFYRIIEQEGANQKYSNIIKLENIASWEVNVYPVPANDHFNISIAAPEKGSASIQLFDPTGMMVISESMEYSEGIQSTIIEPGAHLSPGIYLLRVHSNGNEFVQKIVIQK